MTYAAKLYVQEVLGLKYTNFRPPEFSESFKETSSKTPVFFILSAGVDPTRVNIPNYLNIIMPKVNIFKFSYMLLYCCYHNARIMFNINNTFIGC